ncbi:Related to HTH domain of SpoOJ/ParA/ParB/repB family, involved in chromosome partitioning [hydrothermal vent metagenome]|uniref:Related to HTH domain of SpoOJ/ParA/ParB/repB family, involved in chromosome partitioning n=1 Tax=hydrothermal vent metagenome TaxID=652676 RepID=A0A3B0YRY1_9ZZZZ
MTLIRPFKGLRPTAGHADDVIAPPYDVLNTVEARARVTGRPWSFLHISKPEIDLAEGVDPHDPSVYAKGRENLDKQISSSILARDEQESYYLYQLQMGDHIQTGLVAIASVADYDVNRIKKHEFTRPQKEDDRVRQIDALNAQTGPVFLTYKNSVEVDSLLSKVTAKTPDVDTTADDGIRHTLWAVADRETVDKITALFDAMESLYIADGHHRSAAASRVAAMRGEASTANNKNASHDYFLTVIFPDNQMKILDYNRVIKDLNGLSVDALLKQVSAKFTITESSQAVSPDSSGVYGMYLDKRWFKLQINSDLIPENDPVGRLDVSLLANELIEPVLGISDPRRDERIDFVGGIRGLEELERRVDNGDMAIAFSLFPTSLADLMAVADADEVMPPKSTWFEPKLADGLVSHVLD